MSALPVLSKLSVSTHDRRDDLQLVIAGKGKHQAEKALQHSVLKTKQSTTLQSMSKIILGALMFFLMLLAKTRPRHTMILATLTKQMKFWPPIL